MIDYNPSVALAVKEETNLTNQTTNHCKQNGVVVHYSKNTNSAIKWLEENGGGIYHNNLHKYDITVKAAKNAVPANLVNGTLIFGKTWEEIQQMQAGN